MSQEMGKHYVELRGNHRGIDYMVVAQPSGHRCGYILVPDGHPWRTQKEGYTDIDCDVHGGLTFSQNIREADEIFPPGYWIGFDCAHLGDVLDPDIISDEYLLIPRAFVLGTFPEVKSRDELRQSLVACALSGTLDGKIRTKGYVEAECKSLAEQCAEAAGGNK